MSRKDSKKATNRKVRHILNKTIDFFGKISGRSLNRRGYGRALAKMEVRDSSRED